MGIQHSAGTPSRPARTEMLGATAALSAAVRWIARDAGGPVEANETVILPSRTAHGCRQRSRGTRSMVSCATGGLFVSSRVCFPLVLITAASFFAFVPALLGAESVGPAAATASSPATSEPTSQEADDPNWPAFDPVSTWKPGAGTTFYVSPDGIDIQSGTKQRPLGSLKRFFQVARPGDTCLIRGGVYKAEYATSAWARLSTNLRGTPEAWITIRNYPGERVVIDTTEPGSDFTFLNLTRGNAYLRFEGLTFRNFRTAFNCDSDRGGPPHHLEFVNIDAGYSGAYGKTLHNTDGKPIRMSGGTHDVIIRGCEFHHVAGPGVYGLGSVSRVLIEDTVSHDNDDAKDTGGDADGVTFTHDGKRGKYPKDITLRRVSAWNCSEDGIDIKGDRITLEDCAVRNVGAVGYKLWSTWMRDPARGPGDQPLAQGHFRVRGCRGLDVGQTVLKMYGLPQVELADCLFLGTDGSTWGGGGAEMVLLYRQAFGWEPWRGRLRMTGTTVVQRSAGPVRSGPYPAVEIDSCDRVDVDVQGNVYQNARRPNLAFILHPSGGTGASSARLDTRGQSGKMPPGKAGTAAPILLGVSGPRQAAVGQQARWSAEAADPNGGTLEVCWSFGDGQSGVGQQIDHAYEQEGKYTVSVTADAGEGRKQQKEFAVEVAAPASASNPAPSQPVPTAAGEEELD